eukprot:TRINITY_DN3523_c0_g1_i3.p1 TRINITY_DN3523_c0_g1~~TRINITY_DN3523_c0_g1_i3.p1  ORF type:complete len:235 (-),score=44.42 TRINITY_DN3523_c0_g1_i3:1327-2031(-)
MTMTNKPTTMTPKALIYRKYGDRARYKTEPVLEEAPSEGPQMKILVNQAKQYKYRCRLHLPKLSDLPELSVTSAIFRKKKDAEQDAARIALEKPEISFGVDCTFSELQTEEDKWEALVDRVSKAFSDEFLIHYCPFIVHFRAAIQRQGKNFGLVSAAVLSAYDTKIGTICKQINNEAESNPMLSLTLVLQAAKSCHNLHVSVDSPRIYEQEAFSIKTIEELKNRVYVSSNVIDH